MEKGGHDEEEGEAHFRYAHGSRLGQGESLEVDGVRHRDISASDALHRGVEVVKAMLHSDRGNLGGKGSRATASHPLPLSSALNHAATRCT